MNIRHKVEASVLHVTIEGEVTVAEIAAYVRNHINVWVHSPRVLWNLRKILFPLITSEQLASESDLFGEVYRSRAGWLTAIVVRSLDDQMGKFLVDLSEAHATPVEYRAFVSVTEAVGWLNGD